MILAAGLTPAWQQIMVVPRFEPGEVNRAREVHWCASGKVLNVGCALHHLGAASQTLCPVGGITGAAMRREFESLGVPATWLETAADTRVCTTILDEESGQTTELVENSQPLTNEELGRFAEEFARLASTADLIVLSGSTPSGTPVDYFRGLIESVRCPVLLDFRGPELTACLPLRPWLVKPNRHELAVTVGRPLPTEHDVIAAMQELQRAGAQHVVISDGPGCVWALGPDGVEQLSPPQVDVVNPIGCGDCLAAGIAVGHSEGRTFAQAVEFGIAAAAENARDLLPARIRRPSPSAG